MDTRNGHKGHHSSPDSIEAGMHTCDEQGWNVLFEKAMYFTSAVMRTGLSLGNLFSGSGTVASAGP